MSLQALLLFLAPVRTPDTWDLLPMQRVEKGRQLKQKGADFMKAKDFRRACWVYLDRRFHTGLAA